jgi:D-3-phosphoglycerate dehydrogenase
MLILNMADTAACPDVFAPLAALGEVVSMPAQQELLFDQIGKFDVYFASLNVRADRSVLDRAKDLRAIATPSTGTDHIDLGAAREKGIAVISLKDDTEFLNQLTATAELAWALLLATVRRLPWAFDAARRGNWARDEFRGRQISGLTLGVLGYGRLGKMVAEFGKAFRMRVLACNDSEVSETSGVQMVDFETLLRESDVLSIHIHLTERNLNLLDREAIFCMKKGAILINTSRGAIIDETALLEALETGHLAGAGLDVIDGEWEPNIEQHPLLAYARQHQNLVVTPHIGGVTIESQRMAFARTVQKLADFLTTQGPR